jgi:heptosyltransferase II
MNSILIELPTWLGDAVMSSPAIENLLDHLGNVEITLLGSQASIDVFKNHPKVIKIFVLDKSLFNLYKTLKSLKQFDMFFSFRASIRATLTKFCIKANIKFQFDKNKHIKCHQVKKYNNFINDSLKINLSPGKLTLHNQTLAKDKKNKLLGINPGASYGSSKQWYPNKFAEVAIALSSEFDIIIFGGSKEKQIARDIEKYLVKKGVSNFFNLAAKTSINQLINEIDNLDLLVTGDSGPMHLAAALNVPTVAIFGPTKDTETSQWMNEKSKIVKTNLECQPCMKRTCPLKHHKCMKDINAEDVLKAVNEIY